MSAKEKVKESAKQLHDALREKREKLRQLRFLAVGGRVKNVSEIKKIKKEIARILTKLNQKQKIN